MKINRLRRWGAGFIAVLVLIWPLTLAPAAAQSTDAALSGTIRDPSGALNEIDEIDERPGARGKGRPWPAPAPRGL